MSKLVMLTGAAVTLFYWLPLNDAVQQPKLFLLLPIAAWLLGTVAFAVGRVGILALPKIYWAYFLFALGVLVAALATDVKYTAFFGESLRSMGALSYLSLVIIALVAMMSFSAENLKAIKIIFLGLGGALSAYGFLQSTGHDPAHFYSVFSPVIGTLGNPDFMSGILGVSAIAALWAVLTFEKIPQRIGVLVLFILEVFVIKKTASSQGFLVHAVGLVFLCVAIAWQKRKAFGIASLATFAVLAIPVILGLLNKGPFASRIYRATLQNRFDYWHSAIGMGKAHLLAGVGLERFGDSYFQYAPVIRIVQNQGTDNAHNVFLQFFATGGLILVIPYLLLIIGIVWISARGIKNFEGKEQIDFIAILSMWVGLLLVSLISIDNLGETIWFWILGGALCGAALLQKSNKEKPTHLQAGANTRSELKARQGLSTSKKNQRDSPVMSSMRISSIALVVIAFFAVIPQLQISSQLDDLRHNKSKLDRSGYVTKIKNVADSRFSSTQAEIFLVGFASTIQETDLAIALAKKIVDSDPRSFAGNFLGAQLSDAAKNYPEAIAFRERLAKLDPVRADNLFELEKDYLAVGNREKALQLSKLISAMGPGSDLQDSATAATLG